MFFKLDFGLTHKGDLRIFLIHKGMHFCLVQKYLFIRNIKENVEHNFLIFLFYGVLVLALLT